MKKQWVMGLAAFAMTGLALAAGPGAARKRAEASMLVTGDITVAPDGSVSGYTLDRPDRLPPEVAGLIGRAAPKWRFEPVKQDGQAVSAKAHMSIRLIAQRQAPDSESYVIHIAGASFGEYGAGGETITYAKRTPPSYPPNAVAAGVQGTVYLLLRVGRDGKVADASVEQVNLGVAGSDTEMRVWRNVLANPALRVAKDWTFNLPTQGTHRNDPEYVTRVPITYRLNRGITRDDRYGTWEVYVPGPKEAISWAKDPGQSADALPDDGLYLVNSGLKLTTPLDNNG
jgi:hypothetical protein